MNTHPAASHDAAIQRLVADGILSAAQAEAVRRALAAPAHAGAPSTPHRGWSTVLAEVGGYVGAAFVGAAAAVITGPRWGSLGVGSRVAVLGVPALLMLLAAVLVAWGTPGGWTVQERRGTGPRRRLVSALVLLGGSLAAGVTGVLAHGDYEPARIFGTALAVWLAGYVACRGPLLHVAVAAALASTAAAVLADALPRTDDGGPAGAALLIVALAWLTLTALGILDEAALGLVVGGILAFVAGESLATWRSSGAWQGYTVLAVLAVTCLAGYVRARHVAVLAIGVTALATVVPQAVLDYTDGALGAAGALLLVGLSIVAASVVGLRLHRTSAPAHPSA